MKNFINKMRSSMAVNMIGAIILLLALFGVIVSALGIVAFRNAFQRGYSNSTYHLADTAASLINGDHLDDYLAGEEMDEYRKTRKILDNFCRHIRVSLIYVIQVDRSDYGRFVCIFDLLDNSVDQTDYKEWELGHQRDTTNEEYRQKYMAICEEGKTYETIYRLNPEDGVHPHITTLVPVKNSAGEVSGILCVQRPIRELNRSILPYVRNIVISTLALCLLSAFYAASYIKKSFVVPIMKVSREATRFARENTKGEPLGEISRFEELSGLADSIDTMESDMVQYMRNLTAITAEKGRIDAELSLARRIQINSLPNVFPAFPDRNEFEIYATISPAKEVGGDFYNFFLIDEDHLAIVIGDVSGKGVPAALFMMVTNILINDRTDTGAAPAGIMTYVNEHICEHNQEDMFVTLWLGILEISTGNIVASNAGHEDPAICRRDGVFELLRTKHDFVIGGMPGVRYTNYQFRMEKGEKLFLYTDGVPEAVDKDDHMFTLERMIDSLNVHRDGTPGQILDGVHRSVDAFAGEVPQFDDLTMICLEYRGMQSGEADNGKLLS